MSKFNTRHIYTSESVSEGHPDKICDQISDTILDACLALDPDAHVACETAVTSNLCINIGELSLKDDCAQQLNFEKIARQVVRHVGYTKPDLGFSYDTFNYVCGLHAQSQDIAKGVLREDPAEQGAGDQGMMYGYASDETSEMMPAPILLSHHLLAETTKARREKVIDYLEPDSKAQISILYDEGKPLKITSVVLSHQTRDVELERIRRDLKDFAGSVLESSGLLVKDTQWHINPTGRFVVGGPQGDSGLTGRKLMVDTYGGVGAHGGGAFSGKDPSKVDRSAAYYARYVAKNIVAAKLAKKCEIQLAYAIGIASPVSINISTFGTGKIPEEKIAAILENGGLFDFRPAAMIAELGLRQPVGWSYRDTSTYGHFGRGLFPWEQTDKVAALRAEAGLS